LTPAACALPSDWRSFTRCDFRAKRDLLENFTILVKFRVDRSLGTVVAAKQMQPAADA
jgi:hypothetical protein